MRILSFFVRLSAPLALAMIVPIGSAGAAPIRPQDRAAASQAETAESAARDFYRWYLRLIASNREPGDDPDSYARFVTKTLRARITRQMASPDVIDADYFLKAQDYLDGWVEQMEAAPAAVRGKTARTVITLGRGAGEWRLRVSLTREDGSWKIAGVTRA